MLRRDYPACGTIRTETRFRNLAQFEPKQVAQLHRNGWHKSNRIIQQVNISAKPEERSREDFINVLFEKIEESHKRQIEISTKALEKLAEGNTKAKLIEINKQSEDKIKNL